MLDMLVPCAAYGLLAAASIATVHRFLLPVSREAAVALAALPLVVTGPALLAGNVLAPVDLLFATDPFAAVAAEHGVSEVRSGPLTDVNGQSLPWLAAVEHAWRHGQWPLYNPFILCGQPLAGTAQPAPYEPIRLLSLGLSPPDRPGFLASALLLVAALGGFAYARDLGCVEAAAMTAAAGWMLCDFVLFFLLYAMGATIVLLPLVALAARRVVRRPGPASAVLLTVVLLEVLVAGHPESALHVISAGAALGLWELAQVPGWRARARGAALAAASGALALTASAVFILPVLETIPLTWQYHHRHRVLSTEPRAVEPAAALDNLLHGVVPFQWGAVGDEVVPPRVRPPHAKPWQRWYAGSLLLVPAILGLAAHRWPGRWAVAGLGASAALIAARTPVVADAVASLPLYDTTLNSRLFFVTAFALTVLAALGVDVWWRGLPNRQVAHVAAAVMVAVAATVAVQWSDMTQLGLGDAFLYRRTALLLAPLALAALIAATTRRSRAAALAVLTLLVVQRTVESGAICPSMPRSAHYPAVAPLDSLPGSGEPYRVVGLGTMLIPNAGAVLGFDDPRGDDAVTFAPFARIERLWSDYYRWFRRVTDLERPFLDALNVRFAVVPHGPEPPAGWRRVASAPGGDLLENLEALPRAWVPPAVRLGVPPHREIGEMADAADMTAVAWVRPAHDLGLDRPEVRPNGPGRVRTVRDGTRYLLDAEMDAAGWVAVSEAAWPGWRAVTDGGRLPLARANHAFLAFHLPAGRHQVALEYRPRSFDLGLGLSLGALLLAIPVLWRWRSRETGDLSTRDPST